MLQDYLKAGFPAISILTHEPARAEKVIPFEGHWRFFAWDCMRGIRQAGCAKILEGVRDPVEALSWLNNSMDTVLLAHNLHLFTDSPEIIQAIQNGAELWKSKGNCLVMISPVIQMRPELKAIFTVIDLPLPDTENLYSLQQELGNPLNVKPNKKAARLARGLTEFEAECAYALSLVKRHYFSSKIISDLKSQLIRKSGLLEVWEPEHLSNVGGLSQLKTYIRSRAKAFTPGNEHLPRPKGLLLVGIPGTGKSLSCKAAASILGWPLIRLSLGDMKAGIVGETEKRIRQALQIISAFGESVLWIDEIEKALAGVKSSGETDGGTTSNVLGALLHWFQENTSPVFVMATANDVQKLPPEILRAGRFDSIFAVDLPSNRERREIMKIMNARYGTNFSLEFTDQLNGFSGAEIEQVFRESLFTDFGTALNAVIPLSRTMREEIDALRNWARTRARPANTPDDAPEESRKIRTSTPAIQ
ncbi:AAA family ATPase [Fundidesulfovibrio soli]|uniref:AAA family ATPase n=1 Tax=Fundidesulfovibrio soli TaxID=2922716 RepID=UPI001FB0305D|nr:AAA family ATPase [Fundidesulfovibrio soli]